MQAQASCLTRVPTREGGVISAGGARRGVTRQVPQSRAAQSPEPTSGLGRGKGGTRASWCRQDTQAEKQPRSDSRARARGHALWPRDCPVPTPGSSVLPARWPGPSPASWSRADVLPCPSVQWPVHSVSRDTAWRRARTQQPHPPAVSPGTSRHSPSGCLCYLPARPAPRTPAACVPKARTPRLLTLPYAQRTLLHAALQPHHLGPCPPQHPPPPASPACSAGRTEPTARLGMALWGVRVERAPPPTGRWLSKPHMGLPQLC